MGNYESKKEKPLKISTLVCSLALFCALIAKTTVRTDARLFDFLSDPLTRTSSPFIIHVSSRGWDRQKPVVPQQCLWRWFTPSEFYKNLDKSRNKVNYVVVVANEFSENCFLKTHLLIVFKLDWFVIQKLFSSSTCAMQHLYHYWGNMKGPKCKIIVSNLQWCFSTSKSKNSFPESVPGFFDSLYEVRELALYT